MSATIKQQQQSKYHKEEDQRQTLTQMDFFEKNNDNAVYDQQNKNAVNTKKVYFHDNEECSMQKQDEKGIIIRNDKGHSEIEYMGTQTQELVGISTEARKIYTIPPTTKTQD
jgi:hypothetical protein